MICPRCGTEYEEHHEYCPRCFFGRPKEKKHLPKWLRWLLISVAAVVVIGTAVGIYAATYFDSEWMNGAWEGSDLAITFDTESETFYLSNVDSVLFGVFTADKDALVLTAEDGNVYTYRYERLNYNKIRLFFTQGDKTETVILVRVRQEAEEEDDEELLTDAMF